jgi:hypothetical protein
VQAFTRNVVGMSISGFCRFMADADLGSVAMERDWKAVVKCKQYTSVLLKEPITS